MGEPARYGEWRSCVEVQRNAVLFRLQLTFDGKEKKRGSAEGKTETFNCWRETHFRERAQ